MCCVLRQNTLLSQCLFPHRSLFDYIPVNYPAGKADEMLGSYLEGVITFLVASCYVETGISSGWMGLLISSSTNLTLFNDTCYYMANES